MPPGLSTVAKQYGELDGSTRVTHHAANAKHTKAGLGFGVEGN